MRKYLYAGAVASGLLLLGPAPAHADVIPAPINAQDGGSLLGPDGDLGLGNTLDDSRILNINPGANSPDLTGIAGSVLPDTGVMPAARTGLGKAAERAPAAGARPATGAAEGLPGIGGGLPTNGLSTSTINGLPLLGGGLFGGLLPDGRMPAMPDEESGLLGDNLSLLGALGGLMPTSAVRTLPALSGMPAGGTAVSAADLPGAEEPRPVPAAKPAGRPVAKPPVDPATANDARLHEEPIDPEGRAGRPDTRKFSDGRPVAGVDADYQD